MIFYSTFKRKSSKGKAFNLGFVTLSLLLFFCACAKRNTKFDQYYVQGQILYEKNCSNCHQKSGQGLGLVYPPLAMSDYLEKNLDASFCLMKYGIRGEIIVNGKNFNKPMPGVPSLTELEIAEIATYLNNSWGRDHGIIEIEKVKETLGNCQPK